MLINYFKVIISIIKNCKNWLQIILSKLFNKKIDSIILRDGIKLYIGGKIGKADLSMFHEIWGAQYYNPINFDIEEKDVVFDIGANNGFFTIYASKKTPLGKVYSFEPLQKLYLKIDKTIKINDIKNVILENKAISNKKGKTILNISSDHNGCHSLYSRNNCSKKIEVDVIDLKNYCYENNINKINFLKMDCEGSEYDIITKKNIDFISKTIEKISMEYHDDINKNTHDKIVNLLTDNNFSVAIVDGYIYALNLKMVK